MNSKNRLGTRLANGCCAAALGLVLGLMSAGCSSEPAPENRAPEDIEAASKAASTTELKNRLNEIAASGQGGSATAGLRSSIQDLMSSDPAKAQALLADLDSLEATQDPEQVKALAKQMADKL